MQSTQGTWVVRGTFHGEDPDHVEILNDDEARTFMREHFDCPEGDDAPRPMTDGYVTIDRAGRS